MSYTCIACHVAFADPDLQRLHYKTDWHRYNLKRKVAAMPPVSAETFQEKVKEHRIQAATEENKEGISGFSCKVCQKKFSTHNAFDNHRQSKKHKDLEKKYLDILRDKISITSSDIENDHVGGNIDDISHEEVVLDKALKDAKADINQPKVLKHASNTHDKRRGFKSGDNPRLRWLKKQAEALDDEEMWEDLEDDDFEMISEEDNDSGMKDSDAEQESVVSEGGTHQRMIEPNECLFCLKKYKEMDENIIHMSKSHGFFIPDIDYIENMEGLLKYLGEKVGMGNVCLTCNENGRPFYSMEAVQKHMLDKGHGQMHIEGDAALEYADFYKYGEELESDSDSDNENDEECMELVLPSGGTIGHRSLMRYYKQKFPTVVRPGQRSKNIDKLLSQYRAIGWHGSTQSQIAQRQKDIAFAQRVRSKFQVKLSSKNNRTQMKHFRLQFMYAG